MLNIKIISQQTSFLLLYFRILTFQKIYTGTLHKIVTKLYYINIQNENDYMPK